MNSCLPRDHFDRVVADHQCPACGGRFLGPAMCRGVGDGPGKRAHAEEIATLPVYGCCEPPDQTWAVALPVLIKAPTEHKAYEMAARMVAEEFPARVVERHGWKFHPVALETRGAAALRMLLDKVRRLDRERGERMRDAA